MHTDYSAIRLDEITSEHEDSPRAIVLRHGFIVSHIASILTALCQYVCFLEEES